MLRYACVTIRVDVVFTDLPRIGNTHVGLVEPFSKCVAIFFHAAHQALDRIHGSVQCNDRARDRIVCGFLVGFALASLMETIDVLRHDTGNDALCVPLRNNFVTSMWSCFIHVTPSDKRSRPISMASGVVM